MLKGRIRYFITKYKGSHDESGRIAIIVDGNEVLPGNIFRYYSGYREMERTYKDEMNVPRRFWSGKELVNDLENREDCAKLGEEKWQQTSVIQTTWINVMGRR